MSALLLLAIIVLPIVNTFALLVFAIALVEHLSTAEKRPTTMGSRGPGRHRQNQLLSEHAERHETTTPYTLPRVRDQTSRETTWNTRELPTDL